MSDKLGESIHQRKYSENLMFSKVGRMLQNPYRVKQQHQDLVLSAKGSLLLTVQY